MMTGKLCLVHLRNLWHRPRAPRAVLQLRLELDGAGRSTSPRGAEEKQKERSLYNTSYNIINVLLHTLSYEIIHNYYHYLRRL